MLDSLVEKVALAIESAEVGYDLSLTRLVDGEKTYTLTYSDGDGPFEFIDIYDGYEHIRQRKRKVQAEAVIDAMNEETSRDLLSALEEIRQQAHRHKHSTAENNGTHIALENIEYLAKQAIAAAKAGA